MILEKKARLLSGAALLAWLTVPQIALAQQVPASTPAAGAPSEGLEQIVVTARRTSERLQTTPVAVTALSSVGLARAQIVDVPSVQRAAPNLTITSGTPAASGFALISMRGQANLNAGNAADPAVGIYIDGAYIARPAGALFDLVDMQQVEVLRGPQGTLFGRNTIGGALNMTTNQPNDKLSFLAQATYGNYDDKEFTGVANIPFTDGLDFRVAYKYHDRDGYGHDIDNGRPLNDKRDDNYVRAQLRIAPTGERWSIVLSGDYNRSRDSGQLAVLTGANPLVLGTAGADSLVAAYGHSKSDWWGGYNTDASAINPSYRPSDAVKGDGASARINVDFDWATLKSITAVRHLNSSGFVDLDGTPETFLEVQNQYVSNGFSQELQLAGKTGRFSWITGLFYFQEHNTERSDASTFGGPWFRNFANIENKSYAAYAQGYYQITDKLRFSGGVRYTKDIRAVQIHNLATITPPVCGLPTDDRDDGVTCTQSQRATFTYPSWTAGFDYQATSNIFLYAKTSGAYMAGGFNLRQGALPAFKPEGVKDVEIGLKADWLDKHLRTNIALFHSWQTDVQRNISTIVNGNVTQYITNAGDAHVSGVEFEGTLLPWKGMELTANAGLLRAHYDKHSFIDIQTIAGIPGCAGGQAVGTYNCSVDRSGERLPQVPNVTFSLGATQTVPVSFGELSVHLDYAYIGDQTFAPNTPAAAQPEAVKQAYAEANRLSHVPAYGLLNGRIGVSFDDHNYEISVWGRNLANKKYFTRSFADLYTSLGVAVSFVGDPRTYGVTATAKF
jgi:iron complex outermembrane receptor protein